MIQQVLMPKLGQTMEEATVEKWHKNEGDRIERGDVLLEITTDKATLEVESYVTGTVRKILAAEGVTLPVNALIALVGEPTDPLPADLDELVAASMKGAPAAKKEAAVRASETAPAAEVAAELPPLPTGRIVSSPRARMRAEDKRINLRLLRGSGPGGRIIEKDVLDYAARVEALRVTPTALEVAYEQCVDVTAIKPSAGGMITKEDVLAAVKAGVGRPAPVAGRTVTKPLSAMRRVVADRLSKSKREIPHFYLTTDVDMTDAVAFREKLNQGKPKEKSVSFNDMLIRACGKALGEMPAMNAAWADGSILQKGSVNIGLAVALDDGLIVPVIRDADRRSVEEIAAETKRLVERARGKKLTPDEYEGGSFSISNLGMFGITSFQAIVNPGEAAIMGVGAIVKKLVVIDDAIRIRSVMSVSLSADHRVVDGATAARFLARVRELLEKPAELAGA
jgi:pyruvate dehydrogenase E2 component (dihydrolipoamide acetyltransferase)